MIRGKIRSWLRRFKKVFYGLSHNSVNSSRLAKSGLYIKLKLVKLLFDTSHAFKTLIVGSLVS